MRNWRQLITTDSVLAMIMLAITIAISIVVVIVLSNKDRINAALKKSTSSATTLTNNIKYFHDPRTGICFANFSGKTSHSITMVPCTDRVEMMLINPINEK